MSEPKTGFSKRFAIEIPTGKTRKEVTSIGSRFNPSIETREIPITKRFPPDRIRSLVTRTTYSKDKNGRLTNPNVKVYQEVSIEQWNSLPENKRVSEPRQLKYYAEIAEIPSDGRNYRSNDEVIDALYDKEDADLLKKEISKYKNKEGQFKTVSRVANESVLKNEGLNTNKPDSKNQLGLGKDGPTDVVDIVDEGNKNPLNAPKPFLEVEQKGSRKAYKNLRYPDDLRAELQDVMKFTQLVYGPRAFNNTNESPSTFITGFGERQLPTINGSVILPIQGPITDQNLVNWGSSEMNAAYAFGAAKLMGMELSNLTGEVNDLLSTIRDAATNKGISSDLQTGIKAFLIQESLQTRNLLSRASGAILNPNVELLFRAPQLRPFNFSFFLTAREPDDAKAIKQIIRFFKQGMSVKNTASDIFLRAPNVFKIEYLHKNRPHNSLNLIKECALTNFNVEYTPANTYSTFEDGTMTAYRISLQFTELEPVTEKDYKDKNGNDLPDSVIGY